VRRLPLVLTVLAWLTAGLWPSRTPARTRLENICTIYGQKEIQLVGIGLVVGLKGTGDGGENLPAIRSLAAALRLLNTPVLREDELRRNADNVALVLVSGTIPKTGLRRGQKIDCIVSSPFGAKSLRGGRLLVTPVETADIEDDTAVGLASGPIYIEDPDVPTVGKIPGGIVLEEDFVTPFVSYKNGQPTITLLLDAQHSSFYTSSEVATAINREFSFEAGNVDLARPVGPGVVEVTIPPQYRDSPVDFIAQVLDVGIENPHTEARVVVNPRSQVVVVTGEVEISPVIISHKNLTIEVGQPVAQPAATGGFVMLNQDTTRHPPQQLKQLVDALNQLRVPTSDIISIIRELHRSGKLHAIYDEH